MSDRLALTEAIEDAGIERGKATRIASVIFDAIHQNVATKADLEAHAATVRADFAELRGEMRSGFASLEGRFTSLRADMEGRFARQDVGVERLRSEVQTTENRLLRRLGGLIVAAVTVIVALQHLWAPH